MGCWRIPRVGLNLSWRRDAYQVIALGKIGKGAEVAR
jgi:hypothetical protein